MKFKQGEKVRVKINGSVWDYEFICQDRDTVIFYTGLSYLDYRLSDVEIRRPMTPSEYEAHKGSLNDLPPIGTKVRLFRDGYRSDCQEIIAHKFYERSEKWLAAVWFHDGVEMFGAKEMAVVEEDNNE